jgi:hypothetical protein
MNCDDPCQDKCESLSVDSQVNINIESIAVFINIGQFYVRIGHNFKYMKTI